MSDLISRQAAIDALKNISDPYVPHPGNDIYWCVKAIEELSSVELVGNSEQLEWIPCSERLPELHREDPAVNIEPQLNLMADYYVISDPVLVMRNGPFTDKNERIMVAQYEDDLDGRVHWQTLDAESLPDVVAWMPLPEAMKEGEPNG